MQLKIGDRLTDETGEWEVIGCPYTSAAGKKAHARVQRVNQPSVTEVKMWGAHERVAVRRHRMHDKLTELSASRPPKNIATRIAMR